MQCIFIHKGVIPQVHLSLLSTFCNCSVQRNDHVDDDDDERAERVSWGFPGEMKEFHLWR